MSSQKADVLVIGATGGVGRIVVDELSRDVRVVAASRRAAAADLPPGTEAVAVDVTDPDAVQRMLADVRPAVALVAVEPPTADLHRALVGSGVAVVDVTASLRRHREIERMDAPARAREVPVLLSVGIAPGLTNALALTVQRDLAPHGSARLERLEVTVLLGAGDHHGPDSLRWTFDALAARRTPSGPVRIPVPGFGQRRAHPMPFSDQYTLRRTLGIEATVTRMLLDSPLATTLLFAPARTRLGRRALRSVTVRRLLGDVGRRWTGDTFLVVAQGRSRTHSATRWAQGTGQSRGTALVAAAAVHSVLRGEVPPGVHHLEQVERLAQRVLRLPELTYGVDEPGPLSR
jgi:NAD(P)-dependent dehydrogenase (short-subunit alcohol dehydrogenase family)